MAEKFIWNLQYSVHSEEIDEQHKRFFELINAVYDFLEKGTVARETFLIVLTHLGDYAFYHFATEEGYFKIFKYAGKEAHIRGHDAFRTRVREFLESARKLPDLLPLALEVADFSKEWLTQHILIEDKKYIGLFAAKRIR